MNHCAMCRQNIGMEETVVRHGDLMHAACWDRRKGQGRPPLSLDKLKASPRSGTRRIAVDIEESVLQALDDKAAAEDRTRAQVIRAALRAFVSR